MPLVKADASTVRHVNRHVLLNLLRRERTLSRAQLRELSGLSSAAVTGVVAELIESGLVVETSIGPSSGGRPPVILEVNYKGRAAIGLKLTEDHVGAVLTDAGANIEHALRFPLSDHAPHSVVDVVERAVQALLDATHRPAGQLIGVGVGLPGVIDSDRGVCVHSPFMRWNDVPLVGLLEARLGMPVVIDNDVNALAAAERLFGERQDAGHIFLATVGRGIGAGLVLGGRPYRGATGGAGEFGHTLSEHDGRACECGRRGCLEAYASETALLARYREIKPGARTVEGFIQACDAQEPVALALLDDAGRRLGMALANAVNLLNPQLVVISGEGTRLPGRYFDGMRSALADHTFAGLRGSFDVRVEAWSEDAWARGAASLVLRRTFDPPPVP
ncbi:ROK family transcriptional regulator [Deinococcus pimensis]|uniref:ROK family transcriptional regulator n=1 Tax=Deinococcus pimensis TaxID=309888 RepID=UPI0005EB6739|nr:ROK family transcriptional regulator [Deinococcus pimensis]